MLDKQLSLENETTYDQFQLLLSDISNVISSRHDTQRHQSGIWNTESSIVLPQKWSSGRKKP